MEKYDSAVDTQAHIEQVERLIQIFTKELHNRAIYHDCSKLQPPEKEIFDEYSPKLKNVTYGSDEYKQYLSEMQVALTHHYANNAHHPEFHNEGIAGMTLLDLVEMLCDWKAATMRHADGNILNSIEINQGRFGYSDELKSIFINTIQIFN